MSDKKFPGQRKFLEDVMRVTGQKGKELAPLVFVDEATFSKWKNEWVELPELAREKLERLVAEKEAGDGLEAKKGNHLDEDHQEPQAGVSAPGEPDPEDLLEFTYSFRSSVRRRDLREFSDRKVESIMETIRALAPERAPEPQGKGKRKKA